MKYSKTIILLLTLLMFCKDKVDIVNLQYRSWNVIESGLKNKNSQVRSNACEALGKTGLKEAVPLLIPGLNDNDAYVRISSALSLASLGDTTGKYLLNYIIEEGDTINTIFSLGRLAYLGEKNKLDILDDIFQNSTNKIYKILAACELTQNGLKKYIEYVKSNLVVNEALIKALCIETLTIIDETISPELISELELIDNPTVNIALLTYKGLNGNKESLLELKSYLNHKDRSVRNYAAGNIIKVTLFYRKGVWED